MRHVSPYVPLALAVAIYLLLLALGGCTQSARRFCPKPATRHALAFTASWCGPCQRAKPAIRALQAAGACINSVDIDAQPALAKKYGVTSVPDYVVLDGGRVIERTRDLSRVTRLLVGR